MENVEKDSHGFSLIKPLLVVAIILIIVLIILAIATTNVNRLPPMALNQASAIGSLRTINEAESRYASTYPGFSPTLVALGPPASGNATASAAGMIDSVLAAGSKAGYSFVYAATPDAGGHYNTYSVNANPTTPGTTGTNYYYSDQTVVIRQNSTQQAAATDSPLGG